MKQKVLHFVRKKSQLKASFIQNQIMNHIDFEPVVIFRQGVPKGSYDGGFAQDIASDIKVIDLGVDESFFEKQLFRLGKQLSFRQCEKLRKLVQEIQPDIMHFHYGTDAGIYLTALKRIDIPKVVSFYGYDCFSFPKKYFGAGRLYLKRKVFENISVALAMSPEMKQDLLNLGCHSAKIAVHYHGVPANLTHIQKTDTTEKRSTILMLSYLDPVKGHIFALKALKTIVEQGEFEFKLRIVGTGHYEKQIRQFVSSHQLNTYVDFVGPVKYLSSAYFQEFSSADMFLHPSVTTREDKEGIPGSLVEAMFAGLPVISTNHGGIPFVIQDKKTGLLVEEWDVENLACAIKSLMDNRKLRSQIGDQARKYAESNLDLKTRELALEKIYVELLGN